MKRYRSHFLDERGLVENVVARYLQVASLLVADYPGAAGDGSAVGSAEVAVCAPELPRRNRSSAMNFASALRSLLRFLHGSPGRSIILLDPQERTHPLQAVADDRIARRAGPPCFASDQADPAGVLHAVPDRPAHASPHTVSADRDAFRLLRVRTVLRCCVGRRGCLRWWASVAAARGLVRHSYRLVR